MMSAGFIDLEISRPNVGSHDMPTKTDASRIAVFHSSLAAGLLPRPGRRCI